MGTTLLQSSVLLLTILTVTQGQYYDLIQTIQQLIQPYQQENDYYNFNNNNNGNHHRQETKKNEDRHTKKQPTNQYDYIFSTTVKPNRKTNKNNSSHTTNKANNRNFNTDIIFSDFFTPIEVTTKKNKVHSITRAKSTTIRPFRPTENTFDSQGLLNRHTTQRIIDNNRHTHGNLQQDNHNTGVIDYNTDFNRGSSSRNPDQNKNQPTNTRNPDVNAITQRETNNRNFVSSNSFNNRGSLNTDYDIPNNGGIVYPNNPLINRPGVQPAPVNVNQPAITNRPVTANNFDRPTEDYRPTEGSADTPEILIGPDEDDMSEQQKRRYIEMSERMCDRYKSLSIKKVVALPLVPSPDPVEFNVSSCTPVTVPLVIGGKIASINEFPHMAIVGWRKARSPGYSWKCGGSLISNQYILTAGHCTYQDKDYEVERLVDGDESNQVVGGPPQAVQLGSSYMDDPGAIVMKVNAVIRHPKYKQRRRYYDIALIKMARTVTFSEVIRPACLGVPPPAGKNIIATGWGRTEFGGDHSYELRSVSLPIWNMAQCQEIWGKSLKLPQGPTPESHVCAGDKQGGKDTCQGDSGGPAQIQDGCVWRVVAITSFGRSCGAPNTPALYAVTKRAFIAAQVFGEDSQNTREPNFDNRQPTNQQTHRPTNQQTYRPTNQDTYRPTNQQTNRPTNQNTYRPTNQNTYRPTNQDTYRPTSQETYRPTNPQTYRPTNQQTYRPTNQQPFRPTNQQTYRPTNQQTYRPTNQQTYRPTYQDTYQPSFGSFEDRPPIRQPIFGGFG